MVLKTSSDLFYEIGEEVFPRLGMGGLVNIRTQIIEIINNK